MVIENMHDELDRQAKKMCEMHIPRSYRRWRPPFQQGGGSLDGQPYDVAIAPLLMKVLVDDTACHGKLTRPTNNCKLTIFNRDTHHLKR